jgi:type IV pilus assembly protein PilE
MVNDKGIGMKRSLGFTMLELMIVVVIIAVLSALAIPAYSRYAIRAHREDGQEFLLRIANAQERYYATNNHYGILGDLGFSTAVSENKYYTVTMTPATASTTQVFTATAIPQNGQQKDDCKNLTVDNTGKKAATGTTTNGSCW